MFLSALTILDVGVDVPSVGAVIIAGGGKAEVELQQRVGRGLHKKREGRTCFIADFLDTSNKHLMSHSYERNISSPLHRASRRVMDIDENSTSRFLRHLVAGLQWPVWG